MGVAVQSSSTISSKVWLCWITRGTLTRKMKYTTYLLGILAYPHTNCISIFIIATIWNTDVVCWTSALTSSRSYRWSWRFQWHVEWFSIIFTGLVGNSTHFLVSSDAYRVFLCSEMMVVIVIDSKVERLKVTSVRRMILQASLWWGKGLSTLYLINSDLPSARKCCSYTITISESCYLFNITCKCEGHCGVGCQRRSVSIQVQMMTSVVSTQGGRGVGGGRGEGHRVVDAVGVGHRVDPRPSGHKLHVVQSDGANVQTWLFKRVNTRSVIRVGCGVARVLDMSRVLADGSSTSWLSYHTANSKSLGTSSISKSSTNTSTFRWTVADSGQTKNDNNLIIRWNKILAWYSAISCLDSPRCSTSARVISKSNNTDKWIVKSASSVSILS